MARVSYEVDSKDLGEILAIQSLEAQALILLAWMRKSDENAIWSERVEALTQIMPEKDRKWIAGRFRILSAYMDTDSNVWNEVERLRGLVSCDRDIDAAFILQECYKRIVEGNSVAIRSVEFYRMTLKFADEVRAFMEGKKP